MPSPFVKNTIRQKVNTTPTDVVLLARYVLWSPGQQQSLDNFFGAMTVRLTRPAPTVLPPP